MKKITIIAIFFMMILSSLVLLYGISQIPEPLKSSYHIHSEFGHMMTEYPYVYDSQEITILFYNLEINETYNVKWQAGNFTFIPEHSFIRIYFIIEIIEYTFYYVIHLDHNDIGIDYIRLIIT